ncbi:hypothetical protein VTI74DRAFT_1537 [Chaetomium olivicolor]
MRHWSSFQLVMRKPIASSLRCRGSLQQQCRVCPNVLVIHVILRVRPPQAVCWTNSTTCPERSLAKVQ